MRGSIDAARLSGILDLPELLKTYELDTTSFARLIASVEMRPVMLGIDDVVWDD